MLRRGEQSNGTAGTIGGIRNPSLGRTLVKVVQVVRTRGHGYISTIRPDVVCEVAYGLSLTAIGSRCFCIIKPVCHRVAERTGPPFCGPICTSC